MVRYWTNFARTGDPNTHETAEEHPRIADEHKAWPQFALATQENIVLQVFNLSTTSFLRSSYCDFWDAYTPSFAYSE